MGVVLFSYSFRMIDEGILIFNNSNTIFADQLRSSVYINDQRPRMAKIRDASNKKIRRQSLRNRLLYLNNLNFD